MTASAQAQSVNPVAESGTADAGIASQPIANVAANDTVNGAPATLGASGNSKISKFGTWATGLGLNPTTGAVSTTVAVTSGSYNIPYQLCDLSAPPNCAQVTDTVTVINASIVPNPDSGTADAGIASLPIANVAANDTVNGAPATLGTGGNAKITKAGWPAGLGLTGTGGVTTTVGLPAGVYNLQYQLCDLNAPANCAGTTVTVTVINSSIVPNPDSGSATFGVLSTPIANVAANDSVNGAQATLGTGGNAKIAKTDTWPNGLALTGAGAVTVAAALPAGTYIVHYQLCDLNSPANCATTSVTVTVTAVAVSIVANPESGTADAGIASQPIGNVAANDTINGAPATLGASGNAKIAKFGTWPTGIGLNPTTGAVSTTIGVQEGSYVLTYQLCDLSTPANCATVNDTVTVITASILANPETGIASAGVASLPIANVTSNDFVNGAAVTLGASGNAVIAKAGTWPAGIGFNTTTGAVSSSATVPAGTYSLQYRLCDLNVPANCASTADDVTVTSSIVANPDNATAVAGKASTPIPSVISNDMVNGAKARLQTSPNATVAQFGTWPAGIALNTVNGAVTVAASVPPGAYDFTYKLCDKASPPNCALAADTISVTASLVVIKVAGSAVVGTNSTVIGNVAAHDSVNGAQATLGNGSNAVVSQIGTWQNGIVLNVTTGAISTTTAVLTGNYNVQFQLCDKNTPPNCATSFASVTVTQPFNEVSVSTYVTGDLEFDWGRNGTYCATCNFGQTNAQVNWTDRNNNLWVNGVNPTTGAFTPISGRETLVDANAFFWQDWGNGPEWVASTPPGSSQPISQLVYTRFQPGQAATWQYAGAALATPVAGGGWSANFFPGAITPFVNNTVLPQPSQCITDTVGIAVFQNLQTPARMFTEPVSLAAGTAPTTTPIGAFANGIGERWVACTHAMTFQGDVTIGTNNLQQVFWYNADTQVVQQLTFDPTTKQRAVMFKAPEFLGTPYPYALMTLAADQKVQIYQQTGQATNGSPIFTLYNTIYSPDAAAPFIFNPKALVHCNPTCQSYVLMGLSASANSQQTEQVPNGLGLANISASNPIFKVLVTASSLPAIQRFDPEYYITANGPVVFYNRFLALTKTQPYDDMGIYLIDMQLGPPSGPCVGSSAEGGLTGPVGTCQ